MAAKYFNHQATRTAIEVSVQIDDDLKWNGTGFFVEATRTLAEGARIDCLLLVSNKHVLVEGAGRQVITLNKKGADGQILYGQQERITIDRSTSRYVGHSDNEIDLACLDMRGIETAKYDTPSLTKGFLAELDEERIGIGSDVLYAGYPNGVKDKINGLALMRKGSIASIPKMDCGRKGWIAIDGTILPGNSGGPAFVDYDQKYRLLGVVQARSAVAEDYGFVIKQKYVRELIDNAIEKSASELRETVNRLILESLNTGEYGADVEEVKRTTWARVTNSLDMKRNSGVS